MLENSAYTKMCPMKITSIAVSIDRDHERRVSGEHRAYAYDNCQGQQCAMWCWNSGSTTEGYCGMRGKVLIP